MNEIDWHFYTLEQRGAATACMTDLSWAAARHGIASALETLLMTPVERRVLHQLFAAILDKKQPLDTLGQLGTELRHAVDLARLYSDDLHRNASGVARQAYQAACDVLPSGSPPL